MALTFGAATSDRVAFNSGVAAGQAFTVLMWHFPTTRTAGRRWWASDLSGGGALTDALWSFTANGPLFDVPKAAGSANADSSKTYAMNKWWLNAFTYSDADGPRIYSGDLTTLAAEDPYNARSTSGANVSSIDISAVGNQVSGAPSLAYQGSVAMFARFQRILTLTEIIDWQNCPYADSTCDAYFELGYPDAGTQRNLSVLGAGVNGTVTGATLAAAQQPVVSQFLEQKPLFSPVPFYPLPSRPS